MEDLSEYPWLSIRNGTFYLRPQVPEDIQKSFGKREIWKSLRTKDFKEAVKLWRRGCAEYEAIFDSHREEQARLAEPPLEELTDVQVKAIGAVYYHHLLDEDEELRLEGFEGRDFDGHADDIEELGERTKGLYARGQQDEFFTDEAREVLTWSNVNLRLREGSPSWRKVVRELQAAHIRAAEDIRKRNAGDIVDTPELPQVEGPSPETPKAAGITLLGLFELWERDHLADGKSTRTVADFRQKIEDFIAYLGHAEATEVSPKNVADYIEYLRHEKGLSAKTIKAKYLAAIRTIYRTGMAKIKIDEDPSEPVKIRVPKAIRERPKGFTDEEAEQILTCALRDPSTLGDMAEHNKLACRWVPWICAYTGARAGEITQLRREDFIEEYGIHCLRITPEAGSVKTGQFRMVPVHPHLIDMGLLDFVRSRPSGPLFYVPTERKRSRGHQRIDLARLAVEEGGDGGLLGERGKRQGNPNKIACIDGGVANAH